MNGPLPPPAPADAPVWVFGYGSLMWNPGFAWLERRATVLTGWQRAFCRYSFRHRGTPQSPGLVIGLREGGECKGIAFRPDPAQATRALEYLDAREGDGYHRLRLAVTLDGGSPPRTVPAWVYVPNTGHPSYFGRQDPGHVARLVARGAGESGTAYDYLVALIGELECLGVEEPELGDVLRRAALLRNGGAGETRG